MTPTADLTVNVVSTIDPGRRDLVHCGKHVYAPRCWWCDTDAFTRYDAGSLERAVCAHCEHVFSLTEEEQYFALEPQRLDDRMRELRERGWQ